MSAEIRARLGATRLSGKSLADMIGLSQNYVAKRLRDEAPFTLDDVSAIVNQVAPDLDDHMFIVQAYERNADAVYANLPPIPTDPDATTV